eukprot:scaffold88927_cov46-Prasinocladus_malaysianus.AAC.1
MSATKAIYPEAAGANGGRSWTWQGFQVSSGNSIINACHDEVSFSPPFANLGSFGFTPVDASDHDIRSAHRQLARMQRDAADSFGIGPSLVGASPSHPFTALLSAKGFTLELGLRPGLHPRRGDITQGKIQLCLGWFQAPPRQAKQYIFSTLWPAGFHCFTCDYLVHWKCIQIN